MPGMITLADFLTEEEIQKAVNLYQTDRDNFHRRCLAEVIEPNMDRINAALGQDNNASYLAYVVEFVVGRYGPRK